MPAGGGLHPLALRQPRSCPLGPMQTLRTRAMSRRLTLGSHRHLLDPSADRPDKCTTKTDLSHAAWDPVTI